MYLLALCTPLLLRALTSAPSPIDVLMPIKVPVVDKGAGADM